MYMAFDNNVPVMDFVAVLMSFFAIVISGIAIWQTWKINTTNLQSIYYENVFKKYLLKSIPKAYMKIKFENGSMTDTYKKLNNVVMDMLQDAKYFEFAKKDFYGELQKRAIKLDEKLVSNSSKIFSSMSEREAFKAEIKDDIGEIFKLINRYYSR